MAVLQSALPATKPHVHVMGNDCPYCEQPIPNDRLDQVRKRIEAKDRERQSQFEAKAKADLEALRRQSQQTIDTIRSEAATREAAAIAQGRQLAEQAMQAQLAQAAEATKAANERREAVEADLARSKGALVSTIEKMNAEFAMKEQTARLEARAAAVQELVAKVSEAEMGKAAAEKKAAALLASKDAAVKAAVEETREALEKAKTDAVNGERSKHFEEKLKLEGIVEELKRKLQNLPADELGDGAEIDLFEVLKAEFPSDDIQRVGRGKAGADIIHKVRHNGAFCGCIVYDSKNHQQWRTDHVAKLRLDQMAEKAEHAVLSTQAFPKGKRELHIDDGVIVAKPGRAVVVAMILRKQVVQLHCLNVSNEERSRKSDELYALMTSDRFEQFISSVTRTAEQLETLQHQERKAHDSVWKKQGEFFRTIIRNCTQFDAEVARIVGTAE